VEHGKPIPEKTYASVAGSSLESGSVRWIDARTVEIQYGSHTSHDRITTFYNRWYPSATLQGKDTDSVEVVLLRDPPVQSTPPTSESKRPINEA
jgi:hypothetical protein